MSNFDKIDSTLIAKARQANLINYLRERHPDSIRYINHPQAEKFHCWRSTKHDSMVFFSETDPAGHEVYKYHRWSNREQDDGIAYLQKYEGYAWPAAVRSLAYFTESKFLT